MKLLCLCDSPTLQTGFARVAQNLLRHWASRFERIDVWAIGYNGHRGKPGTVEDNIWQNPPFVLYAATVQEKVPWYHSTRLQALLNHIMMGDYTHLWVMQDHFLLSMHNLPQMLRLACEKKRIRSFFYIPVDGTMEPDWVGMVEAVDCPVAYTQYGREEIIRHTGQLRLPGEEEAVFPHVRVLPHGVDPRMYRPLPNRASLRDQLSRGWLQPDDFVLLNVNANQRRKDIPRTLEILARLKQHGTRRYRLLLHMSRVSTDQTDIDLVARQLGLVPGEDYAHMDDYFHGTHALISEEELNKFYNIADLLITTTLGEGWGLSITEALAAGCPVAVPAHTACDEITFELRRLGLSQDRYRLLPCNDRITLPFDNSRVRPRVNVAEAGDVIDKFAARLRGEGDPRPALPREALQWLDWKRIAAEWMVLFRHAPARPKHYFIECYGGLGDVFATMFQRGVGKTLENLAPDESATVALYCNNPAAREVFQWHPKRDQIRVIDADLWKPGVEGAWPELVSMARRTKHLPRISWTSRAPETKCSPHDIQFYPSPEDARVIEAARHRGPYLVVQISAGLPDRTWPVHLVDELHRRVTVLNGVGLRVLLVGRTYARHGREELRPSGLFERLEDGEDLVDKLSAPGAAMLLRHSHGLIACHSALSLLAWYWGIPQLLFYPPSVRDTHLKARDQWGFGIENGLTVHGEFSEAEDEHWRRFVNLVGARQGVHGPPMLPRPQSAPAPSLQTEPEEVTA